MKAGLRGRKPAFCVTANPKINLPLPDQRMPERLNGFSVLLAAEDRARKFLIPSLVFVILG